MTRSIVVWRLCSVRRPSRKQAAEIAADVASITDPATGQWVYERLAASRPHDDAARQYAVRLQQMIQQLTVDLKETADEATQEKSSNGPGSSREPRSPSC